MNSENHHHQFLKADLVVTKLLVPYSLGIYCRVDMKWNPFGIWYRIMIVWILLLDGFPFYTPPRYLWQNRCFSLDRYMFNFTFFFIIGVGNNVSFFTSPTKWCRSLFSLFSSSTLFFYKSTYPSLPIFLFHAFLWSMFHSHNVKYSRYMIWWSSS